MSNVSLIDGHIDEMTDNEIIKALECCKDCSANLNVEIIDLINRQQAEFENAKAKIKICAEVIERQDTEIERLNNNISAMVVTLRNSAKATRNEAIKEFAEKLNAKCDGIIKDKWNSNVAPISWTEAYADFKDDIDNLVKEMVGEE